MSAILLLLRSRLLRPVFIALGVALVIEVGLALALTRATIVQLVETLDTHLGEDVRVIAAELERAGQEVRAGLASLSQRTEERLAAGLSVRLEEEQVRLREVLVAGLRRSADDQASLLAAVAPKAIWDNDVPALTELARMAQRNPDVLFAIYINASGERLTRHLNRQDKRVQALLARGQGKGGARQGVSGSSGRRLGLYRAGANQPLRLRDWQGVAGGLDRKGRQGSCCAG